ncbi:MAG: NUDIX domain-containing protein [Micromonosporaceae bacterium]
MCCRTSTRRRPRPAWLSPLSFRLLSRPSCCAGRERQQGRTSRDWPAETGKIISLGGHVDPGESDAACALREAQEEAKITIAPDSATWRGALTFIFPARPELSAVVTVFFGQAPETYRLS